MQYTCRICGRNVVQHEGDVCAACLSAGHSESQKKRTSRKILLNTETVDHQLVEEELEQQVYEAPVPEEAENEAEDTEEAAIDRNQPVAHGVIHNVTREDLDQPVPLRWLRSFFQGVPYSFSGTATLFQIFPSDAGNALNEMGNAFDEAIVYGKISAAAIAESSDVEIYGYRDADNHVIVRQIRSKASGAIAEPSGVLRAGLVRGITIAAFAAILGILFVGGSFISGMAAGIFGTGK